MPIVVCFVMCSNPPPPPPPGQEGLGSYVWIPHADPNEEDVDNTQDFIEDVAMEDDDGSALTEEEDADEIEGVADPEEYEEEDENTEANEEEDNNEAPAVLVMP